MVDNCEFGNMRNEMIRDRLIVNIRNQQVSERLQMENTGKGREAYAPKSSNWAAATEVESPS